MGGFLSVFEAGCQELGLAEGSCKVGLMCRLKGPAAAWLQGLGESAASMSYSMLRQELQEHFGGEVTTHVRTLQRLK